MQLDQIHILRIVADMLLDLLPPAVHDAQIGLIQKAGAPEDLVNKTDLLLRAEFPHQVIRKGLQHRRLLPADRNQRLPRQDQSQRDGGIGLSLMTVFDGGDIEQDQGIIIAHIHTGAFLIVQRSSHVRRVDPVGIRHQRALLRRGRSQSHPDARLEFLRLMYDIPVRNIPFDHNVRLFLTYFRK